MNMALKQQLHQRQVQKLILAPALQQAIKLLPLTNLELIEIIDTELSQNPMLETQEEEAPEKTQEDTEKEDQAEAAEREPFDSESLVDDKEFETYFQQYFDDGFRSLSFEKKEAPMLENIVSRSLSLWDHLDWQANLTFFDPREKEIAEYIIGNINEDSVSSIPQNLSGRRLNNFCCSETSQPQYPGLYRFVQLISRDVSFLEIISASKSVAASTVTDPIKSAMYPSNGSPESTMPLNQAS